MMMRTEETVSLFASPIAGQEKILRLAATVYLPPASFAIPYPGLIVAHGAGSRRTRHEVFCREACDQGFAVLALDFRGHGDSDGFGDGPLEEDVLAAASFLRSHPAVDAERVCYRGSSMGGFYGLKAAHEARFAAMTLLCPAPETTFIEALDDEVLAGSTTAEEPSAAEESPYTATTPTTRWDAPQLRAYFAGQNSRLLAAQVECPVLLVHVRQDEVVPFSHSLTLVRHLRTETTLLALDEGSHSTAQHDPRINRYTIAWLTEAIKDACTART